MTKRSNDEVYVESILNRDDGSLPFGLSNPVTNNKLVWICGYGEEIDNAPPPIVGIFRMSNSQKSIHVYDSIAIAMDVRDSLKANGWREMTLPKTVIRTDGAAIIEEIP